MIDWKYLQESRQTRLAIKNIALPHDLKFFDGAFSMFDTKFIESSFIRISLAPNSKYLSQTLSYVFILILGNRAVINVIYDFAENH